MRDYKFRGKTKKGEWVYGSLVVTTHGFKHMPHTHTKTWIVQSAFGNGGWFNIIQRQYVSPETVGQYTGILDKQGVEIYEGDIVLSKNTFETKIAKVIFMQGSFACEWLNDDCYSEELSRLIWNHRPYSGDGVMFEVIGNIYDNSDLLK